jgi:hypothetical protein
MLTREDVEKQAWIGDQRAAVLELIESAELVEGVIGKVKEGFRSLEPELRVHFAKFLCEGTSMQVTPR